MVVVVEGKQLKCGGGGGVGGGGKTIEMKRWRRENNKIVEEGIITLRRENIKIVVDGIKKLRANIKIVEEGNQE